MMFIIKQALALQNFFGTSWSCQHVPSRTSGSQSHGRTSSCGALDPLLWAYILEDSKLLGILGG
jgi:hypothetical protein